MFSGLAATVVLMHGLTQTEYGTYATWLAVVTFAAKTNDVSISSFTTYYLPRQPAEAQSRYMWYAAAAVSALALVGGTVVGFYFAIDGQILLAGVAFLAVLSLMVNRYLLSVLRGLREFGHAASAETVHTILKLAIFAAGVAVVPTPEGILIGFVIATLTSIAVALYHLNSGMSSMAESGIEEGHGLEPAIRKFREFAPYEVLNGIAKSMISEAPIWLLAGTLGVAVVAYWNALRQFLKLISRTVSSLTLVFYPNMSVTDAKGEDLSQFVSAQIKYCLIWYSRS